MSIFDAETTRCVPEHTCCDVCASTSAQVQANALGYRILVAGGR